jgi:hypothetical protein
MSSGSAARAGNIPRVEPSEELLVRATMHLPGLAPGQVVVVDPSVPYIADALASECLVPVEPTSNAASTGGDG